MQKKSDTPLNATAASLLGFLHEKPMTGWDLLTLASHRIGNFWSLTRSQVYREINTLIDRGFIAADSPGPRSKRLLHLRSAGREAFREWIAQMPAEEIIRFPLLLSVSFSDYIEPARLREYVASHQRIHRARLSAYEKEYKTLIEAGVPATNGSLLTLSFGIRYEQAALEWMNEVLSSKY